MVCMYKKKENYNNAGFLIFFDSKLFVDVEF